MMTITSSHVPSHEIAFHPHSFGDPDGRLFHWNGALYRGISHAQAPFFARLFEDGVIRALMERGLLVQTEVTPLALDGYDLVVRHQAVPFVSYPEEWCPDMLKDAALTILDLAIDLARHGLTLKDGHPWNVVFDACNPIYVDLTSIVTLDDKPRWPASESFCRFLLYPLILMANGHERIARRLLPEYEGVRESDVLALTRGTLPSSLRSAMSRPTSAWRRITQSGAEMRGRLARRRPHRQLDSPRARIDFLTKLRRRIEAITLLGSAAVCLEVVNSSATNGWADKQRKLQSILTDLRPDSVLDIGGEAGWVARTAGRLGSQVIAFSADSPHAAQIYRDARGSALPILSLVMDFVDPTPSRGIGGHWAIAAPDRLRCDLAVASNAALRSAWARGLTLEHIVDGLAVFARRWLVVESPFHESQRTSPVTGRRPPYRRDALVQALGRRFDRVQALPERQGSGSLLVCEV